MSGPLAVGWCPKCSERLQFGAGVEPVCERCRRMWSPFELLSEPPAADTLEPLRETQRHMAETLDAIGASVFSDDFVRNQRAVAQSEVGRLFRRRLGHEPPGEGEDMDEQNGPRPLGESLDELLTIAAALEDSIAGLLFKIGGGGGALPPPTFNHVRGPAGPTPDLGAARVAQMIVGRLRSAMQQLEATHRLL